MPTRNLRQIINPDRFESFDYVRELSPDLLQEFKSGIASEIIQELQQMGLPADDASRYYGNAIYLGSTFVGESILIGTTPTLIKRSSYPTPYLLLNPSQSVGISQTVTAFNGTVVASGNSQGNPVGVAGYNNAHIFLNVTAITPASTWDFYAQVYDPVSLSWVDSQAIAIGVGAVGTTYQFVGSFGVATDMAFRWVQNTPLSSITFTIGVTLKDGLGGTAGGLTQTIYLGGAGVSLASGYPLLAGSKEVFIIGENVELYGIAATNLELRIFRL